MDLARYVPIALAMVSTAILIAKYPGFVGLPRERVRSTLLTFASAFVLFVALDLVSGHALTSLTDIPRAAVVLLAAVSILVIGNVIYLLVRSRRAPH